VTLERSKLDKVTDVQVANVYSLFLRLPKLPIKGTIYLCPLRSEQMQNPMLKSGMLSRETINYLHVFLIFLKKIAKTS